MNRIAIALSLSASFGSALAQDPAVTEQPVGQQPVGQTPVGQTPVDQTAGVERLDVIELKNGERFEGRVLAELDGYVEFELEAGSVVGIGRDRVKAIQRGAGAEIRAAIAGLEPRDEWFVLHDARGTSVGWLHAAIVVGADGVVTVSEEYEFAEGRRRYQVTSQCRATAQLQPLGCYFRERVSEPMFAIARGEQDRVLGERIVDARCDGDRLVVIRADGSGRTERTYDWRRGSTFPLLARTVASRAPQDLVDTPVFDPAAEEFSRRTIATSGARAVELFGKRQRVTEIVESGANTTNCTWLDASMRTLRREIAGPALVAIPSDKNSAKGKVGRATIPAALAREFDGRFGLWVPNPAWELAEILEPGRITLSCSVHDATIGLTRIEHLEPGADLETAVDAVANWIRLLHPGLSVEGRERRLVRGSRSVRLLAKGRQAGIGRRATIDVIPHDDAFLVLLCSAPAAVWDELAGDFGFVFRTIELSPEAIDPPLQGPLRERAARAERVDPRGHRVRVPR